MATIFALDYVLAMDRLYDGTPCSMAAAGMINVHAAEQCARLTVVPRPAGGDPNAFWMEVRHSFPAADVVALVYFLSSGNVDLGTRIEAIEVQGGTPVNLPIARIPC